VAGKQSSATGEPKGYAKAKEIPSGIKLSVWNFSQMQHNIIRRLTNIIHVKSVALSDLFCLITTDNEFDNA